MVQRTGKQTGERVTFVQNNFFHDAFFLKAIGKRFVCVDECMLMYCGVSFEWGLSGRMVCSCKFKRAEVSCKWQLIIHCPVA